MKEKIEPDYETVLKALGAVTEIEYDKLYNLLSDTQQKWGKTIKENKRLQERLKECIEFIEVLCDSLDYEGILGDDLKEKLKKMKKWGVK